MDTEDLSSGIGSTHLPAAYVRPELDRRKLSEASECEIFPVIGYGSFISQKYADACKNVRIFQKIEPHDHVATTLWIPQIRMIKPAGRLVTAESIAEAAKKLPTRDASEPIRLLNFDPFYEGPSDPPTFKTFNDLMHYYLPDHTQNIPDSEFMHNVVHKVVKRWGSLPIRGFNQEAITSKRKTDCARVLYALASKLIKKPKKLELLPDKYGPGVLSIALISQPSSGEQSSPGGDGEGHYQGHESSATAGSSDLPSPALNNTPSASDQRVGASALLGNRNDDEQPPPDRSLSDMESGVAPPAERRLNPSSVAQICLPLSSGVCIAPLQIWYAGTSLTPNAKILLVLVVIFGVAGLLLSFVAYWFQRKRKTSAVMTVMGCVFTICGFLSILGTRFPEKAMIWLTAALWTLPMVASPFALKELV